MHPLLLDSEHLKIPAYGVLYLTAYLSSIFTLSYLASRLGIRFWKFLDVAFMIAISGEAGARVTFLIVEWPRLLAGQISWTQLLVSGRVVLGGVVIGVATAAWMFRRHRFPVLAVLDATLTSVPLGMGIGRLGCLLAGCCYGKPTNAWWGITFSDPLAATINGTPLGVPLVPTQIIQSLEGLLLFVVFFALFFRRRFDGQLIALFFMVEGVARFLVEFLRGDDRGQAGALATSQWIGIAMLLAGALIWWLASRRNELTPAATPVASGRLTPRPAGNPSAAPGRDPACR